MPAPEIEVSAASYRYPSGTEALVDVTAVIDREVVAIVGQNGSGKTTLAKHLNALLLPTAGVVRVRGVDTRHRRVAQLARDVALAFQNPSHQIFHRTVEAEVAFGPTNLGFPPARVAELVAEALELLGLEDVRETHPYELPFSLRKAVCVASVVAMDSPVLVLDEPTTGQDAAGLRRLGTLVGRIRERSRTVVAITHDMQFVSDHFPRVIVMGAGRILFDGPTREGLYREDVLARTSLRAPAVVDLAMTLGLAQRPLTVEELVAGFDARSPELLRD